MKKFISLVAAFGIFLFVVRPGFAAEELAKIADNVYAYVGGKEPATPANSYGANAGIVIGKDGVLVVDALISAKEADRFIADIRKVTDKPIRYVVDTHYHPDHAFGNSEFLKLGAVIIASTRDKEALAKNGDAALKNMQSMGLSAEDMRGTELAVPTLSFSDRMTVDLGDEKVELIYPGPSHSDGSALVLLPKEKILFSGDALFTDYHPYMADGNIPAWLKTLDFVQKLDVTVIIPGHGPLSTKKDVADLKSYIQIFDAQARRLASRLKDPQQIADQLKKVLPQRSHLEWAIAENVRIKYLSRQK